MNNTFIGYFDSPRESVYKRHARKIYLAIFLAMAVGGFLMAANAYQYSSQTIGRTTDFQNAIQTAGVGSPSVPGTAETLSVPDQCLVGPLDTEQGYIRVVPGHYYIDDPLPLCMNDEAVSDWFFVFEVFGGYEPWDGFVVVWQKGQPVGGLVLHWEDLGKYCHGIEEDMCCAYNYYELTFTVCDDFCLDSNQYPIIEGPCALWAPDCDQDGTIPGKEVFLQFVTFWTGCDDVDSQGFMVISARGALVLENFPPFPPTPLLID